MTPEEWQRIEELYHAALERPPAERASLLAQADPDLRRRVEFLLAQPNAGSPLDRPAWDGMASSTAVSQVDVLAPGRKLGNFEIISLLGRGGMGEVYRARDLRLRREVAIKVLPESFARDRERTARFEREARAAGAINHPNVVSVYEFGEENGRHWIATELVSGETLQQRISSGPLPTRNALEVATQIADGLAAAYTAGIIHRDLKPGNIMITRGGQVKILDFGLAKQLCPSPDSTTADLTDEGMVLGTVAYMSPEQVRGEVADHRSDLFSFGVVLCEMLCGERAFSGASSVEVMNAILKDDPPELPASVPEALARIVRRCLEKERDRRFQSAADLGFALQSLPLSRAPTERPKQRTWGKRTALLAIVSLATILCLVAVFWRVQSRATERGNPLAGAQFTRLTNFGGQEHDAVIAPNGSFVAFLSDRDGPLDLWVSQIGSGQFVNLTKGGHLVATARDARTLAFSSDGTQIAFRTLVSSTGQWRGGTETWIVQPIGGNARRLLQSGGEPMWSADGSRMVYHTSGNDSIFIAEPNGSNPAQIFEGRAGEHCHYLSWSRDGRFVYFVRGYVSDERDVWRVASTGGQPERITNHNARVAYPTEVDDHTLLYSATADSGAGAVLYSMDLERRVTRPITVGVHEYASVSASADGRHLVATELNPSSSLWTIPIKSALQEESVASRVKLPSAGAIGPRFGIDYLLYLSSTGGPKGLWKYAEGSSTELWSANSGGLVSAAELSADKSRICFVVRKQGRTALYQMGVDGTHPIQLAPSLQHVRGNPSWSPDGKWLVISGDDNNGPAIFKAPTDGGRPVRLIDGLHFSPIWSPDGRMIVYAEPAGGPFYHIMAASGDATPIQLADVSCNGPEYLSDSFRFLPGGRELVVLRGESRHRNFWLIDFYSGRERQLTNLHPGEEVRSFDISPDGKQIIFDRIRQNSDIVLIERMSH